MVGRNLGGLGESDLERWSHQVGITPNPVKNDVEGWDYLLQFPFGQDLNLPTLDQRTARVECLVQVKATDSDRRRLAISLSIWEKLVRSPIPAFFLVIEYAGQSEPQNSFLIHVGNEWIESVLKRLRALKAEEAGNLHKKKLDLTWNEADKLDSNNGDALKSAVLNTMSMSMAQYAKNKLSFLESAGAPVPYRLKITSMFETEQDYWEQLVDFAIGVSDELPSSSIEIDEDVRFGIAAKTRELKEGLLSVTRRPVIPSKLVFERNSDQHQCEFQCQLYSPNWFLLGREIPEQYVKHRAVFEVGEAIINPFTSKADFRFEFSEAREVCSISEHTNTWRLVFILADPAGFTLKLMGNDGRAIGSGIPTGKLNPSSELLYYASVVDCAYFVARFFDFPLAKDVQLEQILSQGKSLLQLRQVCDLNSWIDAASGYVQNASALSDEIAQTSIHRILFDDLSLLVVAAIGGQLVLLDEVDKDYQKYDIRKPRRLAQESLIISTKDFELSTLDMLVEKVVSTMDKRGIDTVVPDYRYLAPEG